MNLPSRALTGLLLAVPLIASCRREASDRCLGFYVSSTQPCSMFNHLQISIGAPVPPARQPLAGEERKRELAAGPIPVAKALALVDAFYPTEALQEPELNRRLVALGLAGIRDGQLNLSEEGDGYVKATYQMVASCVGPPGTRSETVCSQFVTGSQSFDGGILRNEHVIEVDVVLERGVLHWGVKASFVRPALTMNLASFPSCGALARIELHKNADGTASWVTDVPADTASCEAAASERKEGAPRPTPTEQGAPDKEHETGSTPGPANPLAACCAASPPTKRPTCLKISAMVGRGETSTVSALATLKGLGVTCHAPASRLGPSTKAPQSGVVDAW